MTSNDPVTNLRRRSTRSARLGIIAGVIMGVIGTAAGFYFGVLAPAIESGSWRDLSTGVLWAGGILFLVLLVSVGMFSWRHVRRGSRTSIRTDDDW